MFLEICGFVVLKRREWLEYSREIPLALAVIFGKWSDEAVDLYVTLSANRCANCFVYENIEMFISQFVGFTRPR